MVTPRQSGATAMPVLYLANMNVTGAHVKSRAAARWTRKFLEFPYDSSDSAFARTRHVRCGRAGRLARDTPVEPDIDGLLFPDIDLEVPRAARSVGDVFE